MTLLTMKVWQPQRQNNGFKNYVPEKTYEFQVSCFLSYHRAVTEPGTDLLNMTVDLLTNWHHHQQHQHQYLFLYILHLPSFEPRHLAWQIDAHPIKLTGRCWVERLAVWLVIYFRLRQHSNYLGPGYWLGKLWWLCSSKGTSSQPNVSAICFFFIFCR